MSSSKDDSNERDDLNFIYKDQSNEERFLDKVIRAESKGSISDEQNVPEDLNKKKITKDEIIKSSLSFESSLLELIYYFTYNSFLGYRHIHSLSLTKL